MCGLPAIVASGGCRDSGTRPSDARRTMFEAEDRLPGLELALHIPVSSSDSGADGSRLLEGDPPCARALRGETAEKNGSDDPAGRVPVYRAPVTSTPVIPGGKVTAAHSAGRTSMYVRGLVSPPGSLDGPARGRGKPYPSVGPVRTTSAYDRDGRLLDSRPSQTVRTSPFKTVPKPKSLNLRSSLN